MAEPTLSLGWKDIQAKLGRFAGWGRGALFNETGWTTYQQAEIDDATQSGLRNFYFPEVLEGDSTAHQWSFLYPVATLVLGSGNQEVVLPDDYGSSEGPVTILTTATTTMPWRIAWRNIAEINERYSMMPTLTGAPQYIADVPVKGTTGSSGQRWKYVVFPIADQQYTLQVTYQMNPDYITSQAPFTYGGPQHHETILESCYATMEQRLDDSATLHKQEFLRRLATSVSIDRRNKPQSLGPNLDRSDGYNWRQGDQHWFAPASTYNGAPFG